MKKFKIVALCAMIVAFLLLGVGCVDMQAVENAALRQNTETMLDGLIADDARAAYAVVKNLCTEDDFAVIFRQMREMLGSARDYRLELLSIKTNFTVSNGEKVGTIYSVYKMITDDGCFVADIAMADQLGVVSFYLTPYEKTDYYFTGTLSNMQGANLGQWLLLLLNVLALGITVFAIVDCCRKPIGKKILWILILVLGFVTVGITAGASMLRLNFNLGWITSYSALIRYGSGTVVLRLMIPAGAVSYLIARRSLLKKPADTTAPVVDAQQPPQQENETPWQQ